MTEPTLTIDQILAAFTLVDQPYQRAAVEVALQQRDAIIPYLIGVLERTLADPAGQDESVAHLYTLMLLGHFRASAAHEVIVKLFRLPKADDFAYRLFGDTVTEDLPTILLRTCGGAVAQIQELILDRQANDFCRGSGARALNYAVVEGIISREAALEFLAGLFSDDADAADEVFWSQLMVEISYLYPVGWTDTLQSAFDRGLIDESIIDMEDMEEILETGSVEESRQPVYAAMARHNLDDIHGSMEWWAMFRSATHQSSAPSVYPRALPVPAVDIATRRVQEAAAAAKKKQKRKMAKATRKKNRRKK